MRGNLKFLFSTLSIFLLLVSFAEAGKKKDDKDKKDCIYCQKYETLEEWPESERPAAFIYEEFDYPEGMFSKQSNRTSKTEPCRNG